MFLQSYIETFLRNDIFKGRDDLTDIVLYVYGEYPPEQNYIEMCIEQYTQGKASAYEVRRWLENNIIDKQLKVREKERKLANENKQTHNY